LAASIAVLRLAADYLPEVSELASRYERRAELAAQYVKAYRQYCWSVNSLTDLKLAPFHLLASEGAVHTDKDHAWHMGTLARLCACDPELLLATPYKVIAVNDETSQSEGIKWWKELWR
jgi:protein phosphatase